VRGEIECRHLRIRDARARSVLAVETVGVNAIRRPVKRGTGRSPCIAGEGMWVRVLTGLTVRRFRTCVDQPLGQSRHRGLTESRAAGQRE